MPRNRNRGAAPQNSILWFSFAVFVIALIPRVYVATAWSHEPVWDGHYYHFGATRIAEGFGYSDGRMTPNGEEWHPWCHYPVGYSGFLAIFYWLFGASARVGVLVGAFVGAFTALTVFHLALKFLSPRRALVSGLICALHPGLILYAGLLMTEPLAAWGLLLAPLAVLSFRDRPRLGFASSGLVFGLTTLVRPQTLLLVPLLPLLFRARSRVRRTASFYRDGAIAGILTLIGTFAVVLPWTARNCAVMDGCALVSTNGGWNLAIGSSPHATGRFDGISGKDGCREVTGQVQQDRCWWEQGKTWIREDPTRYVSLIPKKLAFTFDHQSFAVGYLAQSDTAAWSEERRATYRKALGIAQYALWFLVALAVLPRPKTDRFDILAWGLGIVTAATLIDGIFAEPPSLWRAALLIGAIAFIRIIRRCPSAQDEITGYVGAMILSLALIHAIFFGEDRYQIVITPALTLLAGAALTSRSSHREPSSDDRAANRDRDGDNPEPAL
jgi:hypothetical protein